MLAGQVGGVCISCRLGVGGPAAGYTFTSLIRKGPFSTMSVDHVETVVDGAVPGIDPSELQEWLDSLEDVIHRFGPDKVQQLLVNLQERAYLRGVMIPFVATTPYMNTISTEDQPRYPGNLEIERKIKSYIRWNAMAMVLRANKKTTWDADEN